MTLLAQAQNLVSFFVAIETLSIPLYILCATNLRRESSLESGLKYLIVGSLGSATLLYGMAFLYGGTGSTGFAGIAAGIAHKGVLGDPLILIGIAMAAVGLAFKTSIAPFHQWTPDVYQGAPTPITSFMAVATKAAAFAVFLRFFDVALGPAGQRVATGPRGARGDLDRGRQRRGARPELAEADARLLGRRPGRLHARRHRRRLRGRGQRPRLLPRRLRLHEPRRLRGRSSPASARRPTATTSARCEGWARSGPLLAWPLTISMLGLAGLPATVGLHRQALPDRGAGRRRLHLARGLHRGRHDDLPRLLPAGGGGDVDAAARARPPRRRPGDRRRLAGRRPDRPRGRPAASTSSPRPCSPPQRPSSSASSPSRWSISPSTPAPRSSKGALRSESCSPPS